ncbi:MAG: helix-turn-helix transcriptional regulator [Rhodospirillaceae bacterium]|jgi:DNA-binding transcriptional ArsR family regulator|nr:helix-turn-helix transcriptional regulator [Rhodospirillaceae bacterium]MBT4042370.1 helix-turn-helix transcriptional regulator [Rhodospirillaceae bacterium]MBT4690555.1 helix-turn-helix transcriptional regulator [Rhodospirillaceae bacterium]MBT5083884.1 helix-turn-helix transcriptional regulator [Rhodospirillaceae bacterium]MBT5526644.1 helix-turn-helix transcriptional regulator [Rhodospirillaceae bacterium]
MNEIIELHETPELQKIADTMEALGNETRLSVFTLLVPAGRKGLLVGEIQSRLKVPASTLSHHLARLIQVGLVQQERQGRKLVCRANYSQMDEVLKFLTRNCCAADGAHTDHQHGQENGQTDHLEGSLA